MYAPGTMMGVPETWWVGNEAELCSCSKVEQPHANREAAEYSVSAASEPQQHGAVISEMRL